MPLWSPVTVLTFSLLLACSTQNWQCWRQGVRWLFQGRKGWGDGSIHGVCSHFDAGSAGEIDAPLSMPIPS